MQFDRALGMNPNEEEAQAALYNKACCHARRFHTLLSLFSLYFVCSGAALLKENGNCCDC